MLSFLISRMPIYIFLLLSIDITFYFFWQYKACHWKILLFGLVSAPRVFTSFNKSILFLCHSKGLHVIIYFDEIVDLTYSKHAGHRPQTFLFSILVHLGLHINFSMFALHLTQHNLYHLRYVLNYSS